LADAEWYEVTTAGTNADVAPAYPTTEGEAVADGTAVLTTRKTVTWQEAGGIYRELDESGEPINQGYIFVPPGFEGVERGFVFDDFAVKPGLPMTEALYARYEDLSPQATDTVRLTLFDKAGAAWVAPSPIPAGTLGTAGWADLYGHVTPPAGFYRARLEVIRTGSGMVLFQDPLAADGEL